MRSSGHLWGQINANLLDVFDNNGAVLPVSELKKLPEGVQRCIKKMKKTGGPSGKSGNRSEVVEVEFYDKQKARELLARLERWFDEDARDLGVTFSGSSHKCMHSFG